MAKERKSAVSLFADMGKNRENETEKVSNEIESIAGIESGQREESVINSGVSDESGLLNREEKEAKLTESDNIHLENTSDDGYITADIEYQNKMSEEDEKSVNEYAYQDEEMEEITPKRRGRKPSNTDRELQHIHIALPIDVYEKLEIGKKAYYNNKTTYIRNLILNDYEKNREYYEKLPTIR